MQLLYVSDIFNILLLRFITFLHVVVIHSFLLPQNISLNEYITVYLYFLMQTEMGYFKIGVIMNSKAMNFCLPLLMNIFCILHVCRFTISEYMYVDLLNHKVYTSSALLNIAKHFPTIFINLQSQYFMEISLTSDPQQYLRSLIIFILDIWVYRGILIEV